MMRPRALMASLALSGALFAGPGGAAPVSHDAQADPAPPLRLDHKTVTAWAARHLHSQGWTLVNFDDEGIRLATPDGVALMSDGLVETDIRHELFQPIDLPPGRARSGLAHWAVDCAHKRFAVISMTVYAHNNLMGEVARTQGNRHKWQTPVDSEIDTVRVVCQSILTGKRLGGPISKAGRSL
jgi:hypothetical protein